MHLWGYHGHLRRHAHLHGSHRHAWRGHIHGRGVVDWLVLGPPERVDSDTFVVLVEVEPPDRDEGMLRFVGTPPPDLGRVGEYSPAFDWGLLMLDSIREMYEVKRSSILYPSLVSHKSLEPLTRLPMVIWK